MNEKWSLKMKAKTLLLLAILFFISSESVQATASSGKPGSGNVPPSPNRAVLGLQCRDIQPTDLGGNGITTLQGALVVELMSGGPAAAAGVQLGDVVVVVGGLAVNTCTDLVKNMGMFEPGKDLQLTVLQQGHARDIVARPMAQGGSAAISNNISQGKNASAFPPPLSMPSTSLQLYQGGGFSLSIPTNWTASVSKSGYTTYFSAPDGRRDMGANGMTILLGVIVNLQPAETPHLLILVAQEEQNFKTNNPGLRTLERRSTVLAGLSAELMLLENHQAKEGRGEKSWLAITLFNDQACFITATSPSADFGYLQNLFGQIITSMRFTNY
jgi:hypothetical protein